MTPIFNLPTYQNFNLIKIAEKKFNKSIYQDTNYSDQGPDFYRFYVCENRNSAPIGAIVRHNGKFDDVSVRKFDGTYFKSEILASIAAFLNESDL